MSNNKQYRVEYICRNTDNELKTLVMNAQNYSELLSIKRTAYTGLNYIVARLFVIFESGIEVLREEIFNPSGEKRVNENTFSY